MYMYAHTYISTYTQIYTSKEGGRSLNGVILQWNDKDSIRQCRLTSKKPSAGNGLLELNGQ